MGENKIMAHKVVRRFKLAGSGSSYKDQIKKIGSYYGTIREVEIQKTGKKGPFLTRIINIYVDPSKYHDNARVYTGAPYSVSKGNVEFPAKTRWRNIDLRRASKRAGADDTTQKAAPSEKELADEGWENPRAEAAGVTETRKRKRVKVRFKRKICKKSLKKCIIRKK
jgi:hypothetical protein